MPAFHPVDDNDGGWVLQQAAMCVVAQPDNTDFYYRISLEVL